VVSVTPLPVYLQGQSPLPIIGQKNRRDPEPTGSVWKNEISGILSRIKPQNFSYINHELITTMTELSTSQKPSYWHHLSNRPLLLKLSWPWNPSGVKTSTYLIPTSRTIHSRYMKVTYHKNYMVPQPRPPKCNNWWVILHQNISWSLLTSCAQPPKHSRHLYPRGQCECQYQTEQVPWQTIDTVGAALLQHIWTGHQRNILALHNPEAVSCGEHAANTFPLFNMVQTIPGMIHTSFPSTSANMFYM
jgi:hypothetical protein